MKKKTLVRSFAGAAVLAAAVLAVGCGKKTEKPAADKPAVTMPADKEKEENTESSAADASQDAAKVEEADVVELEVPKLSVEEFPEIDGSTATLPLGRLIYRMSTGCLEGEAETNVKFTKTTNSYIRLMDGEADLVIAYEAGEAAKTDARFDDLDMKPIGLDALVFLCNNANPVESLTTEEIRSIYTGKIRNWSEVGGADHPIIPFQRPENSGSQTLMEKLMMQGTPLMDAPAEWKPGEMGDLMEAVADYDNRANAIGYSVYYYASSMYKIPTLRLMGVDGVQPENETIRSGEYKYVNPFYAAIRKDAPADSAERMLFDWLTGEDGQSLIEELGYVAVEKGNKVLPEEFCPAEAEVNVGDDLLVINAELYNGNAGIIVFDEHLKPAKYIPDVRFAGSEDFQIARNGIIRARTAIYSDEVAEEDVEYGNLDNKYLSTGLFSVKEEEWVVEPVYEEAEVDLSDLANINYYLWNIDYTRDDPYSNIIKTDAFGKVIPDAYVDPESLYDYCKNIDSDRYEMEFEDGESVAYLGSAAVVRHIYDNEHDISIFTINGTLIQEAEIANIYPIEAPMEYHDGVPYNWYSVTMFNMDEENDYESSDKVYYLLDEDGRLVYELPLNSDQWVKMATPQYCLVMSADDLLKLVNPDGEIITSWRYSTYGETEW